MDPYKNIPTQNYHLYQKYCNLQHQPPPRPQQPYYHHHYPLHQQPQLPYYPSPSHHHYQPQQQPPPPPPFSSHSFDGPIPPKPVPGDTLWRDAQRGAAYGSEDVVKSSHESRNRSGRRPSNGGRGFGRRGHRPNGASPPFHDNKYDRGSFKGSLLNDSASGLSSVASSSDRGVAKILQVPAASVQPPVQRVWCGLCRVYCSSAKIMEQHMNGKRHKNNMMEKGITDKRKEIIGQQSPQRSDSKYKTEILQSGEVEKYKDMQPQTENLLSDKVIAAPERGKKRPRIGGQGCKYMRSNDGARRPVKLYNSKQETFFTCELCNVKCYSEANLQSHLSGKRHFLKLELSHGKQDASGSSSLVASSMEKHFVEPELFSEKQDALGSFSLNAQLCNVKCGSEVDLQSHLSGKRHFLNLELSGAKQDASGSSSLVAPSIEKHFVKPELFSENQDALDSFSLNAQLTSLRSQSQAVGELGAAPVADLMQTPPQGPCLEIQQHQQSHIHGSESDVDMGGAVAVTVKVNSKQESEGPQTSSNEQDFSVTGPECEFLSSKLNAESCLEEPISEDDDPEEYPEDQEEEEEDPEEEILEEDLEEDPPEEVILEEDLDEDPEEDLDEDPEEIILEEDPEEYAEEDDPEEDPEEHIEEDDPEEMISEDEDPEEAEEEDPDEEETP